MSVNPQLAPMKKAVQMVATEKDDPLIYHDPDEIESFIGMQIVPHEEVDDSDVNPCTLCFEWAQLSKVDI